MLVGFVLIVVTSWRHVRLAGGSEGKFSPIFILAGWESLCDLYLTQPVALIARALRTLDRQHA